MDYNLAPAGLFTTNFKLAKKLLKYPDAVSLSSEAANFSDANQEESFYKLASAEKMIFDAMAITEADQIALDNNQADKEALLTEILALDDNQSEITDEEAPFDEDFLAAKLDLLHQLAILAQERQNLISQINSQRIIDMGAAKNYLLTTTATENYEEQLKGYFAAYIDAFLGNISEDAFVAVMEDILSNGEIAGGISHHYASLWIRQLCGNPIDAANNMVQNTPINNGITAEITSLNVFPNPAKESLQIEFGEDFTGKIIVTDMTGKVILQQTGIKETSQYSLSLQNLSNGIYQITVTNTLNGQVSQQKIIVQK